MTFMRKILDKLKLDSTIKIEDEQKEETLQEKEPISKTKKTNPRPIKGMMFWMWKDMLLCVMRI